MDTGKRVLETEYLLITGTGTETLLKSRTLTTFGPVDLWKNKALKTYSRNLETYCSWNTEFWELGLEM